MTHSLGNGPGSPRFKVLVVEDYPDQAESLAILLQLWDYDCKVVGDGAAALEAVATYRPEVVLLDLELPKISGLEVARRLREQPDTHSIPLVAISGYGRAEDRRRARDAGVDLLLLKPTDPNELQGLLERIRGLTAAVRRTATRRQELMKGPRVWVEDVRAALARTWG